MKLPYDQGKRRVGVGSPAFHRGLFLGHREPNLAGPWVLDFNYAKNPLPMNGSRGYSYHQHAVWTRSVRTHTGMLVLAAQIPPMTRAKVSLTWFVLDQRRRDPANLSALAKPMYDGLVDGHVIEDDVPEYLLTTAHEIVQVDKSQHQVPWMELLVERVDDALWSEAS